MDIIEKLDRKSYCHTCRRDTNHGIGYKHTEHSYDIDDIQWEESYMIIQCLGCDTISFAKELSDETMLYQNEFGQWVPDTAYYTYPEPPIKKQELGAPDHEERIFDNVPDLINVLYSQIIYAFNKKSYLLTAVGLRMMLEGICKDLNITEGFVLKEDGTRVLSKDGTTEIRNNKLVGKINGLIENGIIVQKQADILHQIRELGNATVHELEIPKRKTIRLGIEIIENMMYNIYELDKYTIK
ncbi:DUF4145 domain-containing protein [Niallia circulans]|uniref:DUF4145 domain-containing protein n=1 Tax=Niallia circulans TaxID=1397 RepID=UPI002E1A1EB6|nr:DUF4145 domain-containing protein [Niallia circulans]